MWPKWTANVAVEMKWKRETTIEMRHGQLATKIRFYLLNNSFILLNHSPSPVVFLLSSTQLFFPWPTCELSF